MKKSLTSNLEEGLAASIEREWNTSHHLRKRLIEMLERDIDGIHTGMRNEDVNSPNWSNLQAMRIGETKGLQKLISLLK